MQKKRLFAVCLLAGFLLNPPLVFGEKMKINYRINKYEAKLINVTDTGRIDRERVKDFIPQNNGTVIDKRTGLQWMRCSLGQKWTGKACKGKAVKYTWKKAMAERISFAGRDDWRLPTIWELETLVYCSSGKYASRNMKYNNLNVCKSDFQHPTIIKTVFPNTPSPWYWSFSPYGIDGYAWSISFYNGHSDSNKKSREIYVRLVRSGE